MRFLKFLSFFLISFSAVGHVKYTAGLSEEELNSINAKRKTLSKTQDQSYLEKLKKSSEQGDVLAQHELGNYYYYSIYSLGLTEQAEEEYKKKALNWFKQAAKQGHAEAQYMIGTIYYNTGVFNKAFKWVEKSAQQGFTQSQYMTGIMLVYGRGVQKNIEKAFYWFKQAAKQGHPQADEIITNKEESIHFFKSMANESAQNKTGACQKLFH